MFGIGVGAWVGGRELFLFFVGISVAASVEGENSTLVPVGEVEGVEDIVGAFATGRR